jgi:hypothetical protein
LGCAWSSRPRSRPIAATLKIPFILGRLCGSRPRCEDRTERWGAPTAGPLDREVAAVRGRAGGFAGELEAIGVETRLLMAHEMAFALQPPKPCRRHLPELRPGQAKRNELIDGAGMARSPRRIFESVRPAIVVSPARRTVRGLVMARCAAKRAIDAAYMSGAWVAVLATASIRARGADGERPARRRSSPRSGARRLSGSGGRARSRVADRQSRCAA